MRGRVMAGLVAVGMVLAGATPAVAAPETEQFRGDGSSSFGFAWMYARWDAHDQAVAAGFTDPGTQCTEIWAWGDIYTALVIWECTR